MHPIKTNLPLVIIPRKLKIHSGFFLSDDRLITDVHIVQDILNVHMNDENYVELTITVKTKDGYQA